ncbi:MAG: hypothetical protein ACYTE3_30315 [Planctomycetota bacterium]|jgi:hypothetical protein
MAEKVRFFDGKKFMWDCEEYADKKTANEAQEKYSADGFEVQSCSEDGKILLYTRRVVTEVVVE